MVSCCVSKEFLPGFDKHHRVWCYQQRHKLRSDIFSTNPGKKKNPLSPDKSWAIPNGKGIGYVLVEKEKMKKTNPNQSPPPLACLPASQNQDISFSEMNESNKLRSTKRKQWTNRKGGIIFFTPCLDQSKTLKGEVRPWRNQRTRWKFAGSLCGYLKNRD